MNLHTGFGRVGLLIAALALGACNPFASNDKYDTRKMDFKSPPAKVSTERNKGAFASGAAVNTGAALKALDPAPVKEVRLDTTHKIIEIAPGVKYSA